MAWIESHQSLGNHPKLFQAAKCLGISRPQLIGHLMYLWWWAMDYAMDGSFQQYAPEQIAEAAKWEGDAMTFINALESYGFIDLKKTKNDGWYEIHDWFDFCGDLIKKRLEYKASKKERSRSIRIEISEKSQATVPNRTVQNQKENVAASPPHRSNGFAKPTAQEATAYARTIGFKLDGEKFVAYYESNGWKVGRNAMKSWQAAVVTWKKSAAPGELIVAARPYVPLPPDRPMGDEESKAGAEFFSKFKQVVASKELPK